MIMQEPNHKSSDKIPDGYFLYNSVPFNHRLNTPLLNGYVNYLFYRIYISNRVYKPDDKLLALNSIISNVLTAHYNHKLLAVSFNPNVYKLIDAMYGMTFYTYTNIVKPIQWMRSRELIGKASGFYDTGKKSGMNSRIWALLELIREVEGFILVEPVNFSDLTYQLKYDNPIVLKKKKQLINYRPTEQTLKMRKFLDEYNYFMNSQEISVPVEVSMRQKNNFQMSDFLRLLFKSSSSSSISYIPPLYYNSHIPDNTQLLTHTPAQAYRYWYKLTLTTCYIRV